MNNADDALMRRQGQRIEHFAVIRSNLCEHVRPQLSETAMEATAIWQYAARAWKGDPCEEMT